MVSLRLSWRSSREQPVLFWRRGNPRSQGKCLNRRSFRAKYSPVMTLLPIYSALVTMLAIRCGMIMDILRSLFLMGRFFLAILSPVILGLACQAVFLPASAPGA